MTRNRLFTDRARSMSTQGFVRTAGILLVAAAVAACTSAAPSGTSLAGSPPASAASTPPAPASGTPAGPAAVASTTPLPTSAGQALRWIQVSLPTGLVATTGSQTQNAIFGWSKGYLAFHESLSGGSVVPWASGDGRSWNQGPALDSTGLPDGVWIDELVEGPAGLLAVGRHPGCADDGFGCTPQPAIGIWTSTDGLTWSRVNSQSAFGGASVGDVSAGANGYMALSLSGNGATASPAIWLSADGRAWHSAALSSAAFADAYLERGTVLGSGYVVAGRTGSLSGMGSGDFPATRPAVWWSADGSSWSPAILPGVQAAPEAEAAVTIVAAGKLVAHVWRWDCSCAPEGVSASWTSTDGHVWTSSAAAFPQVPVLSDGHRALLVLGGSGGLTVEASTDGFAWAPLVLSGSGPADLFSVAYGPDGLLVEGTDMSMWLAAIGSAAG